MGSLLGCRTVRAYIRVALLNIRLPRHQPTIRASVDGDDPLPSQSLQAGSEHELGPPFVHVGSGEDNAISVEDRESVRLCLRAIG